jgi:hypothetical protein
MFTGTTGGGTSPHQWLMTKTHGTVGCSPASEGESDRAYTKTCRATDRAQKNVCTKTNMIHTPI